MGEQQHNEMRPVIGVVPLWDSQRSSFWMLPGYFEGISQAGGLPVMLPLTEDSAQLSQLLAQTDGILFPGGQDVDPGLYQECRIPQCEETFAGRDRMEHTLLQMVLDLDKPAFGICRGIQFLNVFFGGTLYQNLSTQHPSGVSHRMKPPYHLPAHTVSIDRDSPLFSLLGTEKLEVNSCHHQAVRTLGQGLKSMAISEDGLIEAVCHPDYTFLWAVQWHPEFCWQTDAPSRALFRAFVEASGTKKKIRNAV